MKKHILSLFFCAMLAGSSFAGFPAQMRGYDLLNRFFLDKEEEIALQGSLETIRPARFGSAPVRAFLSSSTIEVDFLTSLGNITITITDGNGTPVYQSTVNAIANEQFFIDITGWYNGSYTIYLTAENGSYLSGNFNITN